MLVDDKMYCYYNMVPDENNSGRYKDKYLIHYNIWGVYMIDKRHLSRMGIM